MEKKLALCLLAGIIIGIILGVESVHLSDELVCPKDTCLDQVQVKPVSDRGYFPEAHEILQKAQHSIHIASFELKYYVNYQNSTANILVEDLIEAHERGVEVKILVDEFSNENNAFELLREHGIELKMDSEEVTTHAKLVIVDGETVILGSTNLSFYGLEKNNEVNVVLIDKQTAEYYEKYFWNLWDQAS